MNDVTRDMLIGLNVRFHAKVQASDQGPGGWTVTEFCGESHRGFDQLLVTIPAPQVRPPLQAYYPEASEEACILPCWSLVLAFEQSVDVPFDAAKVAGDGPISWVARNSSKPGRPDNGLDCWVVQADHDGSREHISLSPIEATVQLLGQFMRICKACGIAMTGRKHVRAHRWHYAHAMPSAVQPCMIESATGFAVGGDWLSGGRIENALSSGLAAAQALTFARNEQIKAAAGI